MPHRAEIGRILAAALAAVACTASSCGAGESLAREHAWAEPLEGPGLENLHRVSAGLYRGAQPDREGFETLAGMGIRTVVNLRADHSDTLLVEGLGLEYVEIPMTPDKVTDGQVAAFLEVARDPLLAPVFVHCQHGADRTGVMVAAYRVAVEGWKREEAIAEMTRGGFGYHSVWKGLVEYMRTFDPERVGSAGAAAK